MSSNYFADEAELKRTLQKAWFKRQEYIESSKLQAFRLITKEELGAPLAVDIYGYGVKVCAVFQQYDFDIAEEDLNLLEAVLKNDWKVENFFYKKRFRVKDTPDAGGEISAASFDMIVEENGHKFLCNLSNYLDTGLFLDHRDTRKWTEKHIKEMMASPAANKADFQVLNLFAYTGSFSVYAGAAGATMTHTVDLSKTYCDWARKNLEMNDLAKEQHWVYRMDTFEFYDYAKRKGLTFDFIIIDPPTFSRNKGNNFSVQRDHHDLLKRAAALLRPNGEILFSNNCLNFAMDYRIKMDYKVTNMQSFTVPVDFRVDSDADFEDLDRQIHNCYLIAAK